MREKAGSGLRSQKLIQISIKSYLDLNRNLGQEKVTIKQGRHFYFAIRDGVHR